jgi:hypothetical protein
VTPTTPRAIHPVAPAPTSALDALLATDQEIAQRQADADREVRALLDAARADATATAQAAEAALAQELAAIDARAQHDIADAVRTIQRDAAQAVAHYHALADEEVAALAADIVARATGLEAVA